MALSPVILFADGDLRVRSCFGASEASADGYVHAALGAALLECIPGLDKDRVKAACSAILAGHAFPDGSLVFRSECGATDSPAGLLLGPVPGRVGIDGVFALVWPVTHAGGLTSPAARPAGFYEQIVENVGDIIFVVDKAGMFEFLNRRIEHYEGITAGSLTGQHFSVIVHPGDVARCQDAVDSVVSTGVPVQDFNCRVVLPNLTIRFLTANVSRVGSGGALRVLGVARDVTESVELSNRLLARNKALGALNDVVVALAGCERLSEALSLALESILAGLSLDTGAILLFESGRMGLSAQVGVPEDVSPDVSRGLLDLLSRYSADLDGPLVLPGNEEDPRVAEIVDAVGVGSCLCVPLRTASPLAAVLVLGVSLPSGLSQDQMEFLSLAAGILGPAVENAKLHSDLADRANRLAMLDSLAKSINSGREVASILNVCARELAGLVAYDGAVVVLAETGQEVRVFVYDEKGDPRGAQAMHLAPEEVELMGRASSAYAFGQRGHASDFHAEHGAVVGHASGVCAPLVCQGEQYGLVKVWSGKPDQYGERERQILEAAAEHLALAVANARLYEAERSKSLELEVLAKEAQHRVKNNLQMISGLLSICEAEGEPENRTIARCLRQIKAISAVHELLRTGPDCAEMSLKECLREVAANAVLGAGRSDDIQMEVTGEDCAVSSDCGSAIAVIVNELVTNALQHGLAGRDRGHIAIDVECGSETVVQVADDGVGLPADFAIRPGPDASSGIALAAALTEHGLGGTLELIRAETGTVARIRY